MLLTSESKNCFRVLELNPGSGLFGDLMRDLQNRGLKVRILQEGMENRFCLEE